MPRGTSKKIEEIQSQIDKLYEELAKESLTSGIEVYVRLPGDSYHTCHVVTQSEYDRLREDLDISDDEDVLDNCDRVVKVGQWISSGAFC